MRICEHCKVNAARPWSRFCTNQCQREAEKFRLLKLAHERSKRRMLTGKNTSLTPKHVLEREPHQGHTLQPGVRYYTKPGIPVQEPEDPFNVYE